MLGNFEQVVRAKEKNDKKWSARVLHMMTDPELSAFWTRAEAPTNHQELDAQSGTILVG